MHPHRVHVLDEADGDHLVLGVAHHFQLQFLPAQHRFLDQDLAHHARRQPAAGDHAQFLHVIHVPAARAAQGVGRADDQRVAQLRRHLLGFLDAERRRAPRHVDPQLPHRLLENDPVLALLDRVGLHADNAHAVLGEHARFGELRREVQPRLAAQVGQQRVRPLLLDDLRQHRHRQRLDVGHVGHAGVGHDRRRIGVHQHDLEAEAAQRLAGLRAGIVEFAGLANHDRAGANDEHFLDVSSSGHGSC